MHISRFVLAGVVCLIATAALSCSDGDGGGDGPTATAVAPTAMAEGTTVTSDDGALSLFIPDGAMPEGTEVTITTVAREELPGELPQLSGGGPGYGLEPDGLEFSQPVTATLTLDRSELDEEDGAQTAYALVSFSEAAGREALESTTSYVLGEETVTVEAELSHFSVITRTRGSMIVNLDSLPRRQNVGVPFQAVAVTGNLNREAIDLTFVNIDSSWAPVVVNGGVWPASRDIEEQVYAIIHVVGSVCETPGDGAYGVVVSSFAQPRESTAEAGPTRLAVSLSSAVECVESDDAPESGLFISQLVGCEHTDPGVESKVIDRVAIKTKDGEPVADAEVAAIAEGPGLIDETATATTDANGEADLEFRINQFGTYGLYVTEATLRGDVASFIEDIMPQTIQVGEVCTPP